MIPTDTPNALTPESRDPQGESGLQEQQASSPPLPDGITAISVTHYRVGRYTYTNLDDAMAEYRRTSTTDTASA